MGGSKSCKVVTVGLLAVVGLSGCTKKYFVNQPITDAVHIHGIVYGWRCGVGDWWNNPQDAWRRRFSVTTGEPATVTFIRDNGFTSTVETDTASTYNLILSAGAHKIVVKTGFTYPPDTTFSVQLKPGDTTIDFNITYAVLDAWNIDCSLLYNSIDDTLGVKAEWDIIWKLNSMSYSASKGFPALNIARSGPPASSRHFYQSDLWKVVEAGYKLPVVRSYPGYGEVYNVVEAYVKLATIIEDDTTGSFPSVFNVSPSGSYACRLDAAAADSSPRPWGARPSQFRITRFWPRDTPGSALISRPTLDRGEIRAKKRTKPVRQPRT